MAVTGGVISPNHDSMLVMEYMKLGSLYDVLHNDTIELEAEMVVPIVRDITSGMRYLHASSPVILHGDLK